MMTGFEVFAPAKLNLSLHVTGRRADGYHLLDSLVIFADIGDRVRLAPAPGLTLTVKGSARSGVPGGDDNLVLRAARLMEERAAHRCGAAITLEKTLPVAAGIGGGSADAAATLRGLSHLWNVALPDAAACATLGADVPVCLASRTRRMAGTGELSSEVAPLPPVWFVLANPGVPVATAAVFSRLTQRENAAMPAQLPRLKDAAELAAFLRTTRNDLKAPALELVPEISEVLAALAAQPGCLFARMSGSGATCFGLFAEPGAAASAARALARHNLKWWVRDAGLCPADAVQPVLASPAGTRAPAVS